MKVKPKEIRVHLSGRRRQLVTSFFGSPYSSSLFSPFCRSPSSLFLYLSAFSLYLSSQSLSILFGPTLPLSWFSHIHFFFWHRPTSSCPNTVFFSIFSIPTPFFPLYSRCIHRRLLVMHIYCIWHIYSVESKSFFICLHTPLSTVTDNTNTYYLVCDLFMN